MDSNFGSDPYVGYLTRRGLPLANWCCMCWRNGETVDRLLIHRDFAHALSGDVFQMFGIHWVMLGSAASLLFCWRNWFGKYGLDVWNMVLGCLMWIIVELLFTMFIHFLVRPSTWYFCDFLYAFWSLVFIIVKNKVLSLSIIMHYLPIKKSIILKMEFISDCLKEIICVFGSSSNCVCF